MTRKILSVFSTLLVPLLALAADKDDGPKLKVGDAAPKLQCGKFVQGDAVKSFEKGKVYVVEFWATWCGPCRQTIPHLNALAEDFKDKGLVVIGQNVWEKDDDKVAPFVKKMGDRMTYRVALDDKSKDEAGAMAKTWMEAAGQDGIPAAFVVDQDGKIAWIGHPMDGLGDVVEAVLAGKFDAKKEASERAKAEAEMEKDEPKQAEVTLHVGDAAPKLQTGEWVQGGPVKGFEAGKIYVVEFWATWCPPCRTSIPHLNEIWQKNKDKGVIVIGQNVSEENDEGVAKFVKKMGEKMTYPVALDDKSKDDIGAMNKTWMMASGQQGIPCAFVVGKDGKIVWIGHPMAGLDKVIEGLLDGTFDPKKEAARRAEEEKNAEKIMELSMKLGEAMEGKEWDEAQKLADEIAKNAPAEALQQIVDVKFRIFDQKKDGAGAAKMAAQLAEKYKDNAEVLNVIAWDLVTIKSFESKRDLDLAAKTAKRATELAKDENPAILDTLARILFMQGEKEKAIAMQNKAVTLAGENDKEYMQDVLESYKKGELPPPPEEEEP